MRATPKNSPIVFAHLVTTCVMLAVYKENAFDYNDMMWGDQYNSTLMDHLQILQNKAADVFSTFLNTSLLQNHYQLLIIGNY